MNGRTHRHDRGSSGWRLLPLLALLLVLAACAAPRLRPDSGLLAAQAQRERLLAAQPDWSLSGRLAISGPHDAGSGSLEWRQHGNAFEFSVNAPVTGKTWTLRGDEDGAELAGLHAEPVRAIDAATVLERELGWTVPVARLAFWVRALRAPGNAVLEFRPDGLPAQLRQDGWMVEYRDYVDGPEPRLPRRVFASKGEYKVRLVVQRWQTP